MKYYLISFPGEFGQHVDETWSEKQILDSFYTRWVTMMIQNVAAPDLDEQRCIDDWVVVHWAVEVEKPGWISEDKAYSEEYDAYYNPTTNEWFESVCDDENCDFCGGRPARPL